MKVIHLELPRLFTFTVKEYLVDVANAMEESGHQFRQYDANPVFWTWLMGLSSPHSPGDPLQTLLSAFDNPNQVWPALREIRHHLSDIGRMYGVELSLRGVRLSETVAKSTYAMCSMVANNAGCGM